MITPTGLWIRSDSRGDGHFGAPRGEKTHHGVDFLCTPAQPVIMPIDVGKIIRVVWPYKVDGKYMGCLISGWDEAAGEVEVKLMYMVPFSFAGEPQLRGTVIGYAQDVSEMYGEDMMPHIHMECRVNGTLINPEHYTGQGVTS